MFPHIYTQYHGKLNKKGAREKNTIRVGEKISFKFTFCIFGLLSALIRALEIYVNYNVTPL
jgi:hypothetical protein